MLKRIEFKNSTLLFAGILFIIVGVGIGFYEYFKQAKDETFSNMNILLLESEMPEEVSSDDELIVEQENTAKEEVKEETTDYKYNFEGILEIPKINLKSGFLNINSKYNNVDYNITVIKGSTYPDETNNNLILAAHSGDCSICYFNKLYKLSIGDEAYLTYKNIKHSYKIVNIYTVEKDGTVTIHRDYSKNCLTLITCTRNSDTKQTVYILEEI